MSTDLTASPGEAAGAFNPNALKAGDRIAETYVLKKPLLTAEHELVVWIAEDELSGAEMSLHFVPGEVAADVKLREALRGEVRRSRQMIHPNILRVHELLEDGDCVAIVADSYDGESLSRRCSGRASGSLQMAEMESLIRPIVRTLADAHSARLVHRNLSPSSVVVTAEGHILLSGFGTTRLIADALQRSGSRSPIAERLLACTSPNGLRNGRPEVADDMYGIGATIFELLTGRPLFQGADLGRQVLTEKPLSVADGRVLSKQPPIRLFKNWEKVLSACLSKDGSARPPSMSELGVQLGLSEDKLEEEPEEVAEPPKTEDPGAEHLGTAAGEEDPGDAGGDEARNASAGGRPIFIPTSTSPTEDGEGGNRTALLVGLLLLAAAAGVWIGTSVLMKQEEPEFEVEEPEPTAVVPKKEEVPSVKFVAPPVPGSGDDSTTSLRPGLPIRPKPSKDVPGEPEVPDTATPVIPEPPVVSVPQSATAPRSAGKHTVEQEAPEAVASAKPQGDMPVKTGLEDPLAEEKRALETARQRADRAKQEEGDAALAKKEREIIEKATAEAEARAREMLQKAASLPAPGATAQASKPGGKAPQEPGADRERSGKSQQSESDLRESQRLMAIARGEVPPTTAAAPGEPAAEAGSKLLENSLGMRFVPVGNVQFSVYETRVRDYATFIRETGHAKSRWRNPSFDQTPEHPVVMVSWTDAMSFCKWLTDREHLSKDLPAEEYYRLPTDAEWSFAAGLPPEKGQTPELRDLGVQDRYPWGTAWPPPKGAGNYTGQETGSDVSIAGYDDGYPYTAPVGSYAPNERGIYDMGGNAWEWCLDTWNLKTRSRVLRGASWFQGSLQFSLLTSCRIHSMPDRETDNYGFRVVRTSAPAKMR